MIIILPHTEQTIDEMAEDFILNENGIFVLKKEVNEVVYTV
jgi:hypothetical protein